SSRRRHTRFSRDWSSDVCSSDLDRTSKAWRETDAQIMALAEGYEQELRGRGVIDFEDMPLLALRALQKHPWLQRALLAKYPILRSEERRVGKERSARRSPQDREE